MKYHKGIHKGKTTNCRSLYTHHVQSSKMEILCIKKNEKTSLCVLLHGKIQRGFSCKVITMSESQNDKTISQRQRFWILDFTKCVKEA